MRGFWRCFNSRNVRKGIEGGYKYSRWYVCMD